LSRHIGRRRENRWILRTFTWHRKKGNTKENKQEARTFHAFDNHRTIRLHGDADDKDGHVD